MIGLLEHMTALCVAHCPCCKGLDEVLPSSLNPQPQTNPNPQANPEPRAPQLFGPRRDKWPASQQLTRIGDKSLTRSAPQVTVNLDDENGEGTAVGDTVRLPRQTLRTSIQIQFLKMLSTFGDKYPQNGCKDLPISQKRTLG